MNERITKVYLLNVPLENDYKHTLYFNSLEGQQSYFQSRIVKSYTDFSYQRKDSFIRVPDHFDDLQNVNYVMYQNSSYSNKWFYAFITDIKYISDERTDIYIETDVMQTWYFDKTIKPSFIEREHVDDDTIGIHTLPEGLETGEYICGTKFDYDLGTAHPVISSTWDFKTEKDAGSFINGIYHGVNYYLIGPHMTAVTISYILSLYADKSKSDSITGIFMVPDDLTDYDNIEWDYVTTDGSLSSFPYKKLEMDIVGATQLTGGTTAKPLENIDTYKPKNNKLHTFPYKYLMLSNNNGGSAIYRYENFTGTSYTFDIKGCITPGCSIRAIPKNYKGVEYNNEEGINLGKYPICSYNTDMYTNWLTQNGVNIALSLASGVGQIAAGIGIGASTGGLGIAIGGGTIAGGVSTISNTLAQVYQHSLIPPQAEGNLNCGDVVYSSGNCTFTRYHMNIKKEYAQIIDKYFDMFGYKVNMVKLPNTHHRSRYWYTKTIDINIDGAIPSKDMQKIKDCYNNGITFWRNASEIQNYELSNEIKNIV